MKTQIINSNKHANECNILPYDMYYAMEIITGYRSSLSANYFGIFKLFTGMVGLILEKIILNEYYDGMY